MQFPWMPIIDPSWRIAHDKNLIWDSIADAVRERTEVVPVFGSYTIEQMRLDAGWTTDPKLAISETVERIDQFTPFSYGGKTHYPSLGSNFTGSMFESVFYWFRSVIHAWRGGFLDADELVGGSFDSWFGRSSYDESSSSMSAESQSSASSVSDISSESSDSSESDESSQSFARALRVYDDDDVTHPQDFPRHNVAARFNRLGIGFVDDLVENEYGHIVGGKAYFSSPPLNAETRLPNIVLATVPAIWDRDTEQWVWGDTKVVGSLPQLCPVCPRPMVKSTSGNFSVEIEGTYHPEKYEVESGEESISASPTPSSCGLAWVSVSAMTVTPPPTGPNAITLYYNDEGMQFYQHGWDSGEGPMYGGYEGVGYQYAPKRLWASLFSEIAWLIYGTTMTRADGVFYTTIEIYNGEGNGSTYSAALANARANYQYRYTTGMGHPYHGWSGPTRFSYASHSYYYNEETERWITSYHVDLVATRCKVLINSSVTPQTQPPAEEVGGIKPPPRDVWCSVDVYLRASRLTYDGVEIDDAVFDAQGGDHVVGRYRRAAQLTERPANDLVTEWIGDVSTPDAPPVPGANEETRIGHTLTVPLAALNWGGANGLTYNGAE